MKTLSGLVLGSLCSAVVLGCVEVGNPPGYHHECEYEYNNLFLRLGLILDHTDTRACDLDYEPEDWIETAFVVYDNKFIWGEFQVSDSMAYSLTTEGYESYSYGVWSGTNPLEGTGSDERFGWGYPREDPWAVEFEWQAQGEYGWEAGWYTDYIEGRVELWVDLSAIGDAIAVIEVTYLSSDEQ